MNFDRHGLVAQQARQARATYPELFNRLQEREAALLRVIARIPSPVDSESSAGFDLDRDVAQPLRELPPGINELAET